MPDMQHEGEVLVLATEILGCVFFCFFVFACFITAAEPSLPCLIYSGHLSVIVT